MADMVWNQTQRRNLFRRTSRAAPLFFKRGTQFFGRQLARYETRLHGKTNHSSAHPLGYRVSDWSMPIGPDP